MRERPPNLQQKQLLVGSSWPRGHSTTVPRRNSSCESSCVPEPRGAVGEEQRVSASPAASNAASLRDRDLCRCGCDGRTRLDVEGTNCRQSQSPKEQQRSESPSSLSIMSSAPPGDANVPAGAPLNALRSAFSFCRLSSSCRACFSLRASACCLLRLLAHFSSCRTISRAMICIPQILHCRGSHSHRCAASCNNAYVFVSVRAMNLEKQFHQRKKESDDVPGAPKSICHSACTCASSNWRRYADSGRKTVRES